MPHTYTGTSQREGALSTRSVAAPRFGDAPHGLEETLVYLACEIRIGYTCSCQGKSRLETALNRFRVFRV